MMFSISTMASSTRMPTTSDSDSSVTTLSVKPIRYIAPKVGMIDSGSAVADTSVARQSRRNSQTTSTARSAPSISSDIEPSKFSSHRIDEVEGLGDRDVRVLGLELRAARARTPSATSTSPAPRLRTISKPTTGLPLSSAAERCSATVSLTGGELVEAHAAAVGERDVHPPPVPRPTAPWRSCAPTARRRRHRRGRPRLPAGSAAAGARCRPPWRCSASRRAGSSSTRISRSTPPTRATAPTPRTLSMRLVTVLSTNHDSASSSMRVEATV